MTTPTQTDLETIRGACAAIRAQAVALRHRAGILIREARETRAALAATMEDCRRTLCAVRAGHAVWPEPAAPPPAEAVGPPPSALLRALSVAGLDAEADLEDLTDSLIAAYADAAAWDDGPLVALLGGALREIGRHIAARIGPRAAGALSS